MKSSKLIQVLSSFSEKEFKELEKFLCYKFDNNSNYLNFIEILVAHHPVFQEDNISKAVVFNKLYPSVPYEDIKIREMMSAVYKQVAEFLVQSELQASEFKTDMALLKQFRKRKFDNLFHQQLKLVKKNLQKDEFRNIEFTRRQFLIAQEENQFFEDQQIRTFDDSIQVKLDNLDRYYFSIKLRDTCEMLNRQRILNHHYDLNLLEDMDHVIEEHKEDYLDYPALRCYYEVYQLLKTEDDEKQLDRTVKILQRNIPFFKGRELKSMFDFALNYCIRQVNKGNAVYTKKLFHLQKLLIDNEILLDRGEMSHISFRNIVTNALKLKEYDWSAKFIENYKDSINERYKENAYNLNKAYLFYASENYEDTVSLLNQVNFTDVYYACSAKFTLLKAYYELKEFETLEYFVTAFNLYLKRNKDISNSFKKSSQNFIRAFKKIMNLAVKTDFIESDKIQHKKDLILELIQSEKEMANKAWLKEKLEEITV